MSSSIPGDPVGMRAKAHRLQAYADQVFTWADRVNKKVDGMRFEGPAAKRIRNKMHAWNTNMKRSGTEIQELAQLLLRSAGDVEMRQAAEERRLEAQRLREEQSKRGGGGGR